MRPQGRRTMTHSDRSRFPSAADEALHVFNIYEERYRLNHPLPPVPEDSEYESWEAFSRDS